MFNIDDFEPVVVGKSGTVSGPVVVKLYKRGRHGAMFVSVIIDRRNPDFKNVDFSPTFDLLYSNKDGAIAIKFNVGTSGKFNRKSKEGNKNVYGLDIRAPHNIASQGSDRVVAVHHVDGQYIFVKFPSSWYVLELPAPKVVGYVRELTTPAAPTASPPPVPLPAAPTASPPPVPLPAAPSLGTKILKDPFVISPNINVADRVVEASGAIDALDDSDVRRLRRMAVIYDNLKMGVDVAVAARWFLNLGQVKVTAKQTDLVREFIIRVNRVMSKNGYLLIVRKNYMKMDAIFIEGIGSVSTESAVLRFKEAYK